MQSFIVEQAAGSPAAELQHSDAQLESALMHAISGLDRWQETSPTERRATVKRAADLLRTSVGAAEPATADGNRAMPSTLQGEVLLCADIIDFHARGHSSHPATHVQRAPLALAEAEAEANPSKFGVVVAMQAWRYSIDQLARLSAPNLLAGNVLLVNHERAIPDAATELEAIWRAAGVPDGAYTNLRITQEQARWLVDDPRIKGVVQSPAPSACSLSTPLARPAQGRAAALFSRLWRAGFK